MSNWYGSPSDYARFNKNSFVYDTKIKKEELRFIRQLGKRLNMSLDVDTIISELPKNFDMKLKKSYAPYINARRRLILECAEQGTLTARVLLRELQLFKPENQEDERKGNWVNYTYVDAKYDFLEGSTNEHTKMSTESAMISSSEDKVKKCKKKIKTHLLQHAKDNRHDLTYDMVVKLYKQHLQHKEVSTPINIHNMQQFKQCYRSLSSNLKRVIKTRNLHHKTRLCDSNCFWQ